MASEREIKSIAEQLDAELVKRLRTGARGGQAGSSASFDGLEAEPRPVDAPGPIPTPTAGQVMARLRKALEFTEALLGEGGKRGRPLDLIDKSVYEKLVLLNTDAYTAHDDFQALQAEKGDA